MSKLKKIIVLIAVLIFGYGAMSVFAQTSQSALYVPLIGISSVPEPFALSDGGGKVTYHYAVKNFLLEAPLTGVQVTDDTCAPVIFIEGDDNNDTKLDYNETWRYTCLTKLSHTTESIATARGSAHNITATHKAYTTVVVGSPNPAPLVSIINVTKIAYPLSLHRQGGPITFTYKVSNPGKVSLSDVLVVDDKCPAMSGKLGDTNGDNLLGTDEVWIYNCTAILKETTTNTVRVSAFANGFTAVGEATVTVSVDTPTSSTPDFPNVGTSPEAHSDFKIIAWGILSVVLAGMVIFFALMRKSKK